MKTPNLAMLLATAAGMTISAAAHAQFVIVNNLPGSFADIHATGTLVSSYDDGAEPFVSSVTNALVTNTLLFGSINGHVANARFDGQGSDLNTPLPVPLATLGFFPLWDNLSSGGGLWHGTIMENGIQVEVIQWHNVYPWAAGGGSPLGDFELKIFASGPVYAQYIYQWSNPAFAGGGSSATIGLQWSATDDVQFSFNTANSVASGTVLSIVSSGTGGSCCLPSGTCAFKTAASCQTYAGVYHGVGSDCSSTTCPQPPQGACCLPASMTCTKVWQVGCAAQGGVYRGDGTSCAVGGCSWGWSEQRDAGDSLELAQVVAGSGSLPGIHGTFAREGDVDMYKIQICDPETFSASTVNEFTLGLNTQLFLFDANGHGVTADDDDPLDPGGWERRSRLSAQFIPSAGVYYLAITLANQDPFVAPDPVLGLPATPIWLDYIELVSGFPRWNIEHQPDQPTAAGKVLDSWAPSSGYAAGDPYYIALTGACYIAPVSTCYANCDSSTTTPVLNVLDFICFLNKFAAGCS